MRNVRNPKTEAVAKKYRAELREHDRRKVAWHEAGHFVVASHYGLAHSCWLVDHGAATKENMALTGQTKFLALGLAPFRAAVIAWAGVLGEEARGRSVEGWKGELDSIWDYYEVLPEDLSATDSKEIDGTPNRRRAFDTAARVLAGKFVELKTVAMRLTATGKFPDSASRS